MLLRIVLSQVILFIWLQILTIKENVEVTLEEMDLFMHGEVLQKECDKGYVAVCYKGHPFGFGKSDGRQIKNKIPKGLRLLPNSHVNID